MTTTSKIIFSCAIVFTLAFTSCKAKKPSEPPAPTPSVSGTWQGSGVKSGIKFTVTVNLAQADGDTVITGDGNIAALIVTVPFTVTGGNNYPDVRMTFTSHDPNFGSGIYVGKFDALSDNAINGAATVPAFGITNEPLRIERTK